jgi:ribosomal protein S18 acetylase RimI-like enzyme
MEIAMESYDTRLRPIAQADVDKIADLEILLFPENCWNEKTLVDMLEGGGGWLSENEGQITGYTLTKRQEDLIDLLRLGVVPTHRRLGIGTKLIEMSLGRSPAVLTVMPNNPAIQLYRTHGFRVVGMVEGAWVMRRYRGFETSVFPQPGQR